MAKDDHKENLQYAKNMGYDTVFLALLDTKLFKAYLERERKRLAWLVTEGAAIDTLVRAELRYRVRWPDLGEAQRDWFTTPEEAIDAAMMENTKQGQLNV